MKTHVLVVDDEEGICEVIAGLVADQGHQVHSALNVDSALDYLKTEIPYLIISDISMPGKSGLDLIEEVRSLGMQSAVVMVTAHAESDKVIRALQLGAIDYLVKPFSPNELSSKVNAWVEIGKRLQELHHAREEISSTDLTKQLRMIELFRLKAGSIK